MATATKKKKFTKAGDDPMVRKALSGGSKGGNYTPPKSNNAKADKPKGGGKWGPDGEKGDTDSGKGKGGKDGGGSNGGGGGNGGGSGGGNKGGGGGDESTPTADPYGYAKAGANLAFNPAIQAAKDEAKVAGKQKHVINSAYDEFQQRLMDVQNAQQMASQQAQMQNAGTEQFLQGMAGNVSAEGQADASARAALLGQDPGAVSGEIADLGAASSQSRAGAAGSADQGIADVGAASLSDMSRRSVAAESDRIGARKEAENYRREAKGDVLTAKKEKGDYRQQLLFDALQQHEDNKLARKSLKADVAASKADQALAAASLDLDAKEAAWDKKDDQADNERADAELAEGIRQDDIDNAQDALEAAQDAKDEGTPGGLTADEKQAYKAYSNDLQATLDIMVNSLKKGQNINSASEAARKRAGVDRWMIQVAQSMATKGKLDKTALNILKGHMPGGVIPAWLK